MGSGDQEGTRGVAKSDFLLAVTQLAAERNLPRDVVLGAIEAALVSAFRRDTTTGAEIAVRIAPNTGEVRVYIQKVVVEKVADPEKEIALTQARALKPGIQLGDTVEIEETPKDAGRIAAQTAKQVVMQRLRDAERDKVYEEFHAKRGELVTGIVQRIENRSVFLDLGGGRTEGLLPPPEQVPPEHCRPGQRLKVVIIDVERGPKGAQVIVSRAHRDLIRRLFELEVPEIVNGTVVIRSLAREAGFRSKVAVEARQECLDAVGACVGLRGIRIQNIVNELQGEKIDVVQWNNDTATFIAHALSPAQVQSVKVLENGTAEVVVPDRHLSLAIGREGQNARLAARLTGWRIDIKSASEALAAEAERAGRETEERPVAVAAAKPAEEQGAAPATQAVPPPAQPVATTEEATAQPAEAPPGPADLLPAETEEAPSEEAVPEGAPEEPQSTFDFEAWMREHQQQTAGPLRFAEEIFTNRGKAKEKGPEDRGKAKTRKGGRRTHPGEQETEGGEETP
ncbi:MAG: transcription termination/antitermination protein NusA [Chloroflexi bacterium]|nr:transcription termination/antitermination protein NusA [Chloroflexota bacterium]